MLWTVKVQVVLPEVLLGKENHSRQELSSVTASPPAGSLSAGAWCSESKTRSAAVYTTRHHATRQTAVPFLQKETNRQGREIIRPGSITGVSVLELEAETVFSLFSPLCPESQGDREPQEVEEFGSLRQKHPP